jgi:signal transduction histidine kinase
MRRDGDLVLAAGRDVTELRDTEQELQHLRRAASIGEFASGLAHDFNNVLTVISGYTEVAQAQLSVIDPAREDLAQVLNATTRAQRLIHQLLAFGRGQPIGTPHVDLTRSVHDLRDLLKPLLGSRIAIRFQPAGEPCWAVVDPAQLDQIVVNLAANARDAIEGTGELTFKTAHTRLTEEYCATHPGARPGDYATLTLIDTGAGMTPDVLGRIFEPFFTTKPAGRGTGLGLSIVYGSIKQAGGYISVDSRPGIGTRFDLHFPRASVPVDAS